MRFLATIILALLLPFAGHAAPSPSEIVRETIANEAKTSRAKRWEHARPHYDSWNTDPIVAVNEAGRLYDKRNGRFLSKEDAIRAKRGEAAYKRTPGIELGTWDGPEGTIGVDGHGFEDGRRDLVETEHGRFGVDLLRISGSSGSSMEFADGGLAGQVNAGGRATLVGLGGEAAYATVDESGLNQAAVSARGSAFVGAEAQATGYAHANRNGVKANATAGAFVGGKVEGALGAKGKLCGVGVSGSAVGEASYGAGATGQGYFTVDWSTLTVEAGARANATLGVGAGAGATVGVSLGDVVRDPSASVDCAEEKAHAAVARAGEIADGPLREELPGPLRDGVNRVDRAIDGAVADVAGGLAFLAAPPAFAAAGNNVARDAATGRSVLAVPSAPGAGSSGVGVTR